MKKLFILIISLILLCGCQNGSTQTKMETDYFKNDTGYLYYYYSLNKAEKAIYQNIYNCLLGHEKRVTLETTESKTIQRINDYVLYDNPEIYYFDEYNTYIDEETTDYLPYYTYTKKEVKQYNQDLTTIKEQIVNSLDKDLSNYEKLKYVYHYVIDNCTYVEDAKDNQYVTSALLFKETVCSGYARAIQYLSEPLGIDCAYIVGKAREGSPSDLFGHAWNMVRMNDDYYYLDATWGDLEEPESTFGMNSYFMMSSNDMLKLYKPTDRYEKSLTGLDTYFRHEFFYSETYNETNLQEMIQRYKASNTAWMELQFSDSCYQEAKSKLIDKEAMFNIYDNHIPDGLYASYMSIDNLNVIILNYTFN